MTSIDIEKLKYFEYMKKVIDDCPLLLTQLILVKLQRSIASDIVDYRRVLPSNDQHVVR